MLPITRDTFDIDSENIETPPIQRKAFRHKSLRLSNGGKDNGNGEDDDNVSDIGSDFSGRRKSTKFRTLTGDGKPLGDRELMLKKNSSGAAKSAEEQNGKQQEAEEEPGLFDRCETRCANFVGKFAWFYVVHRIQRSV